MTSSTNKLLAGALLAGMGTVTGEATLIATAQKRLVQDEAAWRAFHGLLLQALAANITTLSGKLERFSEMMAAWSNPEASRVPLHHKARPGVDAPTPPGREKYASPNSAQTKGFPIGEDETVLARCDPPCYTPAPTPSCRRWPPGSRRICDQRLPARVVQEDADLLITYDEAGLWLPTKTQRPGYVTRTAWPPSALVYLPACLLLHQSTSYQFTDDRSTSICIVPYTPAPPRRWPAPARATRPAGC